MAKVIIRTTKNGATNESVIDFYDRETAQAVLEIIANEWRAEYGDICVEQDGSAAQLVDEGIKKFAEVTD